MAKTSKQFLADLTSLADDLRKQIDANMDGWDVTPEAIAERRRKVCDPVNGFEYWDRNYFPHYGKAEPSVLHQYLYKRLPALINSGSGQRDAIAAPRGEAKSTKVNGSTLSDSGAKMLSVSYQYALSKRTQLDLTVVELRNEKNGRYNLWNGSMTGALQFAPADAGARTRMLYAGIKHNF